ncbi:MAG: signal peptide peptidase SppA [Thermoguttaceae bacterium]
MRRLCLLLVVALSWLPTSSATAAETKEPGTIAVFALDRQVTEAPAGDDFFFGSVGTETFKDLVARIKKAGEDDKVKAVVILPGDSGLGYAQVEELRREMAELRKAHKPIHVHADSLSMRDYLLASGADSISVVPEGMLMIHGLRGETPYVRGLLDMIGVTPDFMTCGEYKSAGEMFMLKEPSKQAEAMDNWLLDSLFETSLKLIADGRNVSPEKAREWIDRGLYTAAKGKEAGIIDTVEFRQDFTATLKDRYGSDVKFDRKYGKKQRDELDLSSPLGLLKLWAQILEGPSKKTSTKTAVAIVYVEGPILPGKPEPSPFATGGIAYSEPIRQAIDQAAADDSIKAVVLRVDSPGGSATASEIILDATRRLKAKKPLVVSMGNVAGSGGYYVACAADTIFADAATITASIGVVSGKFATTEMWNKIGITWHTYDRGANSGLFSSRSVFTDTERRQMRALMDEVYGDFKAHVVAIRGDRLKKEIDELAGGRVFTGRQALELGLVDKIGGLDDAIDHVAKEANVEDYEIRVLPKPKTFIDLLLADLGTEEDDEETGRLGLPAAWGPQSASLLEAALPWLEGLDPQRVRTIQGAFQRLGLIEKEGVIVQMAPVEIRD